MRSYCDICHKEFEKYNHILLSVRNVDIKDVDEILYLYMKTSLEKEIKYCNKIPGRVHKNIVNAYLKCDVLDYAILFLYKWQ